MNLDRLKYRVWCKSLEKYVDNVNLSPKGIVFYSGCFFNADNKDFIIEQCTGLKDKNGKLIYENDLIIAPNNSHKLAIIRMENGVYGCKEYRFNGVWEMNLYDLIKHYGVEIIGNRHEQAEQKDNK